MIPGALAWALIYTTIGWAVWEAAISAVAGSPLMLVVVLAAVIAFFVWRSRRGNRAVIEAIGGEDEPEQPTPVAIDAIRDAR